MKPPRALAAKSLGSLENRMTARWFLVARTLGSLQKKSVKEEIKIKKEELKTIKINNKGEMEVSSQEDGMW